MIDTSMQGSPFYLYQTDENGRQTFSEHTVWNADLFIQARKRDALKLNQEKDSERASAMQITRQQFINRKL